MVYSVRKTDWEQKLYSIRLMPDGMYRVVVFDGWFNVLQVYYIWRGKQGMLCNCPRGQTYSCRHRIILSIFERDSKVNTGWLYNYDNNNWERPIIDPVRFLQRLRQMKERSNG